MKMEPMQPFHSSDLLKHSALLVIAFANVISITERYFGYQ